MGSEKKMVKNIDLLGQKVFYSCHFSGPSLTYRQSGREDGGWGGEAQLLPTGDMESHVRTRAQLGMMSCNPGEYSASFVPFAGSCLCKQLPGKGRNETWGPGREAG